MRSARQEDWHWPVLFGLFFPQRKACKDIYLDPCYKKSVYLCCRSHNEFAESENLGLLLKHCIYFWLFGYTSDSHLAHMISVFPILWIRPLCTPVLKVSLRFPLYLNFERQKFYEKQIMLYISFTSSPLQGPFYSFPSAAQSSHWNSFPKICF